MAGRVHGVDVMQEDLPREILRELGMSCDQQETLVSNKTVLAP